MALRATTIALALTALLLALPTAETSGGFFENLFAAEAEKETTTDEPRSTQSDTDVGVSNAADTLSDSKTDRESSGSGSDPERSVGNTVSRSGHSKTGNSVTRGSHSHSRRKKQNSSHKKQNSKTHRVSNSSKSISGKTEHPPDIHKVWNEATDSGATVPTTAPTTSSKASAIITAAEETTLAPSSDIQKLATEKSTLVIPVEVPAEARNGGAPQTTMHVQMSRTEDGNIVARVDVPMSPPLVKDNSVVSATSMGRVYLPGVGLPFPPKQNVPPFGYPGMEFNPLFRGFGTNGSPWRQREIVMGSRNDWNPWNVFG